MRLMQRRARPIRVLVGKPGLDGHDVGAKVIAYALRDAGMEVIYTGLHKSPDAIVATALEEDVDVIGLSILSGAHVPIVRRVVESMEEQGCKYPLVLGGNIQQRDFEELKRLGVSAIFPTGSRLEAVVEYIRSIAAEAASESPADVN
jgi:methylmalonyl-CoA mutase, C-terminal domain